MITSTKDTDNTIPVSVGDLVLHDDISLGYKPILGMIQSIEYLYSGDILTSRALILWWVSNGTTPLLKYPISQARHFKRFFETGRPKLISADSNC